MDGDTTTAWQSAGKNTEWIMVDFGRTITLDILKIRWGGGFASQYAVHFLDEAGKAVKALTRNNGDGGLDEYTGIGARARYARLLCQKTGGANYTVNELEVYGSVDPVGVERHDMLPALFDLEQNYPNPFNPVTTIAYTLGHTAPVRLALYDVNGREVRLLDAGVRPAGRHELVLDGSGLSSGVYFYKLTTAGFTLQKRMLLIK